MSTQPPNVTELLDPLHMPDPQGDPPEPDVEAIIAELESLDLPSEDGIPLETFWHRLCMNLLIDSVTVHMGTRTDYVVGGNSFVYFSTQQVRNRDYRGPDFFFVDQVPHNPMRESWVVWNEGGRFPDTIIELSSPSTANEDRTTKFRIYEEVFKTADYFIYDRISQRLDGWHLKEKTYEPLSPNEHGRLWCSSLGLWIGRWHGVHTSYDDVWLRFFDSEGKVVPDSAEHAKLQADEQRRLADEQRRLADEQRRLADEQRRRADEEQYRADAAEAELARLRALLAAYEKDAEKPPST